MRLHIVFFTLAGVFALGAKVSAQALQPPVINCIKVQPNGDALIEWSAIDDPAGQFVAYHLWRSNSAISNPFTEFQTVTDFNQTSYTHVTTAPLTSNMCYYITVESFNGTSTFFSQPSDTLCSISLELVPSISPPGQVVVQWTDPYPFGGPAGTGDYKVIEEVSPGVWVTVHTEPYGTDEWRFEVTQCEVEYNYQILMSAVSGCTMVSDPDGGIFHDITPPDIPQITSVSVDHATEDAVIKWNPSVAGDTKGYIIYSCQNDGTVLLLDSIPATDPLEYSDWLAPTFSGPVCYLLAAYDTCFSGIPPSPNTSPTSDICFCSVFLDPITYVTCDPFVSLNWSPFTGWPNGVASYEIYHSFEGGPFELAGTISGADNTFKYFFDVISAGNHTFYIEAVSTEGYRSTSNTQDVLIFYPSAPLYNYLSSASATEDGRIEVTVQTPPTTTEHDFYLQRKKFEDTGWEDVTVLSNLFENQVVFDDLDVEPSRYSYTYRVFVRNLCDQWVDTTNIGKTILLEGLANTDRLVNVLKWSGYEGWENGVLGYRIYRRIGREGTEELIAELNSTQRYYEDDVGGLLYSPGEFCYRVEAVEKQSFIIPGIFFTASSNTLCLLQKPVIWVPSAFVVDGFNSTFYPKISFANFEEYQFIIYSRWGDVIFETTDIEEAWDGRMNGKMVQEGIYVYYVSVEDGNGRPNVVRGTVMMLSNRDQ